MPYSSEVRVSVQSGAPPSINVTLILWELATIISAPDKQSDIDRVSVPVSGGTTASFSLTRGPGPLLSHHDVSLAAYQQNLPGPMFRSGPLATLPAGAPGNRSALVDVMLVDNQRFTMAEINAMIPTPITLTNGTTITTVTLSSAPPSTNLTLVATGPYGATTYTYSLVFTIDPSNDQFDLTRVLEANAVGRGSIVFTAGPGGGFQAFLDNLFAGLFVGKITTDVLTAITTRLNSAAAVAGASAAAAVGAPGGLPAGVVLGVRSVRVASNGDIVLAPAIGSLGSIIDKFLAAAPPSGSKCFIATAANGSDSIQVSTLRTYRDECLLANSPGRTLVACYERFSPPVAILIATSPVLRLITRKLFIGPAYLLANRSLRRRREACANLHR